MKGPENTAVQRRPTPTMEIVAGPAPVISAPADGRIERAE
jgi:hypothetical protein